MLSSATVALKPLCLALSDSLILKRDVASADRAVCDVQEMKVCQTKLMQAVTAGRAAVGTTAYASVLYGSQTRNSFRATEGMQSQSFSLTLVGEEPAAHARTAMLHALPTARGQVGGMSKAG